MKSLVVISVAVVFACTTGLSIARGQTSHDPCALPSVVGRLTAQDEMTVTLLGAREGSLGFFVTPAGVALAPSTTDQRYDRANLGSTIARPESDPISLHSNTPVSVTVDISSLASVESPAFRIYYQWEDGACGTSAAGYTVASRTDMDFRLDAGTVFLFNGDSTVSTKVETAAGFLLQTNPRDEFDADIRYSALPAVTDGSSNSQSTTAATDTSASKFDNASGSLDVSLGYFRSVFGPASIFVPRAGVGFRTLVGRSDVHGFTRASPRATIGARLWLPPNPSSSLDSLYNLHRGYFEIGYSRDGFWTDVPDPSNPMKSANQYNRIYAILEYTLAGSQMGSTAILVRGYLNTPAQLHGATEIRLSALAAVDPAKILSALLPNGGK